ncbi:MAG: hypothetical protein HF314_11840 [Ignavibacteria bacterium]|jgi:Tfp pilus assembly protein PilE|nr:hypothetical protein [Ignavibacteria bacterium]MCU7503762.1 hypothetical protein [Ignavibacteria bacterium]MCU7517224.1 hypothetical protein [Ignavibacteria bacterium]
MGQQQLLLIVLGVIIVGIAVVVGINLFNSSSKDAGRDQVVSNLTNLAAKAQQFYKKPTSLGGGNNNFQGFFLAKTDTGSSVGSFSVSDAAPSGVAYVAGSTDSVGTSTQTIYIVGCGKDNGNDGTNPVKAFTTVTPTTITTTVLN